MAATSSSSGGASAAGGVLTSGSPLSSNMNRIRRLLRSGRVLSTKASNGDRSRRTSAPYACGTVRSCAGEGAAMARMVLMKDDEPAPVGLRRLPGLCRQALAIAWRAAKVDLVAVFAFQVLGAVGIVGLLLVGRGALQAFLHALNQGTSLTALLPWIVAIAAVTAAQSLASAVGRERQQILGNEVSRYIEGRVLDVTANVDLAMFDDPDFHNRVMRTQRGAFQALALVQGLFGLVQSVFGVVAGLVVVVAAAPQLLPLLALVVIPAWLAAS